MRGYFDKYKIYIKATIASIIVLIIIFLGYGFLHRTSGTLPGNQNQDESSFAEEDGEENENDSLNGDDGHGAQGTNPSNPKKSKKYSSKSKDEINTIMVDISGQVKSPNVYLLKEGSRVHDLIVAAGGLTDKADIQRINRARSLKDGEKIFIRSTDQQDDSESNSDIDNSSINGEVESNPKGFSEENKVNINTATKEQLIKIPDIGPAMANRIIEFRKIHGEFSTIEDLSKIKGIGKNKLDKLKSYITI